MEQGEFRLLAGPRVPTLLRMRLFRYDLSAQNLTPQRELEGELIMWSRRSDHEQKVRVQEDWLAGPYAPDAEARIRYLLGQGKRGFAKALYKAGAAYEQALWDLRVAVGVLGKLPQDGSPLYFDSAAKLLAAFPRLEGDEPIRDHVKHQFQQCIEAGHALTKEEAAFRI